MPPSLTKSKTLNFTIIKDIRRGRWKSLHSSEFFDLQQNLSWRPTIPKRKTTRYRIVSRSFPQYRVVGTNDYNYALSFWKYIHEELLLPPSIGKVTSKKILKILKSIPLPVHLNNHATLEDLYDPYIEEDDDEDRGAESAASSLNDESGLEDDGLRIRLSVSDENRNKSSLSDMEEEDEEYDDDAFLSKTENSYSSASSPDKTRLSESPTNSQDSMTNFPSLNDARALLLGPSVTDGQRGERSFMIQNSSAEMPLDELNEHRLLQHRPQQEHQGNNTNRRDSSEISQWLDSAQNWISEHFLDKKTLDIEGVFRGYLDSLVGPKKESEKQETLQSIRERHLSRRRRFILTIFTIYSFLLRLCSFDFFIFMLVVSNIAILYVLRNSRKINLSMAKKSVKNRVGWAKQYLGGLMTRKAVNNNNSNNNNNTANGNVASLQKENSRGSNYLFDENTQKTSSTLSTTRLRLPFSNRSKKASTFHELTSAQPTSPKRVFALISGTTLTSNTSNNTASSAAISSFLSASTTGQSINHNITNLASAGTTVSGNVVASTIINNNHVSGPTSMPTPSRFYRSPAKATSEPVFILESPSDTIHLNPNIAPTTHFNSNNSTNNTNSGILSTNIHSSSSTNIHVSNSINNTTTQQPNSFNTNTNNNTVSSTIINGGTTISKKKSTGNIGVNQLFRRKTPSVLGQPNSNNNNNNNFTSQSSTTTTRNTNSEEFLSSVPPVI